MAKKYAVLLMVLATSAMLILSGCTVIGYSIGSNLDRRRISPSQTEVISSSCDIRVRKTNGSVLRGTYLGLRYLSLAEYGEASKECQRRFGNHVLIPAIGETVSLLDAMTGDMKLEFRGFGGSNPGREYMLVGEWDQNQPQILSLRWAKSIVDMNGNVTEIDSIRSWLAQGKIVSRSAIALWNDRGELHIPINQVRSLEWTPARTNTVILTVMGATIDASVILLAILIYEWQRHPWSLFGSGDW